MLVGYARVSTAEQTLALQHDALTEAGCERLFTDTASGSYAVRPGLDEAVGFLRPGDTLVVWRLDRLGRPLRHLIEVGALRERGVGFKSLQEQLDTTTSGGTLALHVFGTLAEVERDLIRERTQSVQSAHSADRPGPLQRQDQLDRRHLQDAADLPGHPVPVREDRDRWSQPDLDDLHFTKSKQGIGPRSIENVVS